MLARWFSVEVRPSEAPFLFCEEKSQWASTSAELLASLAALFAFGWLQRLSWALCGGTDNLANQYLSLKRSTTRWPLMMRPREENTAADGLTNGNFSQFDPARRIQMSFSDIPQDIIWLLWKF